MISHFFIKLIKSLMVAAPFLTMILMVLALWGVGGKATYTELKTTKQQMEISAGEAKNYLVKGIKSPDLSTSPEIEKPEIKVEEEKSVVTQKKPLPGKVVWGLVV